MNAKFSGFVLAGGKSSRMKTDKAFLRSGGETFLERAISALQSVCETRIKIVLNKTQTHFIERLPPGVSYIFDSFEDRGALGGIHAALKNCDTEFAFILAVDLPLVRAETIEKLTLIDAENFAAIVPRQNDQRLQPLCAVYRAAACLPPLEKLLQRDRSASVGDFLKLVDIKIVESDVLSAGSDVFLNVNRPEDLNFLTG